jgi:CheY-like chemotaxis protein
MPRMNGLEMIKLIRQNPDLQNTRIIVCTGFGSEEIRNQAFESGADRFLSKPFTKEEALGAVADLLK